MQRPTSHLRWFYALSVTLAYTIFHIYFFVAPALALGMYFPLLVLSLALVLLAYEQGYKKQASLACSAVLLLVNIVFPVCVSVLSWITDISFWNLLEAQVLNASPYLFPMAFTSFYLLDIWGKRGNSNYWSTASINTVVVFAITVWWLSLTGN